MHSNAEVDIAMPCVQGRRGGSGANTPRPQDPRGIIIPYSLRSGGRIK